MGYVRFATVTDPYSDQWKLRPKNMSGHELCALIKQYFPDLDIRSNREEVLFNTPAQLQWQETGKPYVHAVSGDPYYRAGFYITDSNGLLPDEFYEECGIAFIQEESAL
jgi:hypothetical protein